MKFYMIYVEGGGPPTYKHYDITLARQEAERLARKTSKKTYLLEAIDSVELCDVRWESGQSPAPKNDCPY